MIIMSNGRREQAIDYCRPKECGYGLDFQKKLISIPTQVEAMITR